MLSVMVKLKLFPVNKIKNMKKKKTRMKSQENINSQRPEETKSERA